MFRDICDKVDINDPIIYFPWVEIWFILVPKLTCLPKGFYLTLFFEI